MNWTEYCALAARTESVPPINLTGLIYPEGPAGEENLKLVRLLHAAMGLVTESQELIDGKGEINWKEELGDCWWYLAIFDSYYPNIFLHCQYNYYDITSGGARQMLQTTSAELLNLIGKRAVYYGKKLEEDKIWTSLTEYVNALLCLSAYARIDGAKVMVEDCWEANITKLQKRYPDLAFNKEHAVNRDVENELSHIKVEDIEEDIQDAQLVKERQGQPTIPVLDSDNFFQQIEKENAVRLQEAGQEITCSFFKSTVFNELQWNQVPIKFAEWALVLSERYRAEGCDAMAEAFKHAYVKLLAIKGVDQEAKAIAVIQDGWALFQLLDNRPQYEGEFVAWLLSKRSVI